MYAVRFELSLLFAVALLLGAGGCAEAEPPAGAAIEPAELVARLSTDRAPLILDVRSADEFAAGHLPGAVNIPHTELADRLASLDVPKTAEIVVHCERGGRATSAENLLHDAGYTNVRDLSGHMQAWRAAGHPVE